jgi:hypothetical protein
MNQNLLLITGLIDTLVLLRNTSKYLHVGINKDTSLTSMYDMSRTVAEIKLYSKYLFNYKTEICCKTFSSNKLKCFINHNLYFDLKVMSSNLNSKIYKLDRFDLKTSKLFFSDFFDELVYFDYCEISIFVSNE